MSFNRTYLDFAYSQTTLKRSSQKILEEIAKHANKAGDCFPSVKRLSLKTRYSLSTVRSCLKELEKERFIIRSNNFLKDGRQTSNSYIINIHRQKEIDLLESVDNYSKIVNFDSKLEGGSPGIGGGPSRDWRGAELKTPGNTNKIEAYEAPRIVLTPILTPILTNTIVHFEDLENYDQIIDEHSNSVTEPDFEIAGIDEFMLTQSELDHKSITIESKETKPIISNTELVEKFEEWWFHYPVKKNKVKAKTLWRLKVTSFAFAQMLIDDVMRRKREEPQWKMPQYVPHPSTYLRDERWHDDVITYKTNDKLEHKRENFQSLNYNPYAGMNNITAARIAKEQKKEKMRSRPSEEDLERWNALKQQLLSKVTNNGTIGTRGANGREKELSNYGNYR